MDGQRQPSLVMQLLIELAEADGCGVDVNQVLYRRSDSYRRTLDHCLAERGWRVEERPSGLTLVATRRLAPASPALRDGEPCRASRRSANPRPPPFPFARRRAWHDVPRRGALW